MKISLLAENLQKKLLFLNHAVSQKSQLPILLNFLIVAKKEGLFLSATDLEIGITTEVPAKIEETGTIIVPAKTFFEIISTQSFGKIRLEKKPEGVLLLGEKTNTLFQTNSQEDFPKLFENKGVETMFVKKEDVEKDFSKIVFAASQDMGRPTLSGVLVKESAKEGMVLAATDGYRLSLKKNALKGSRKKSNEFSLIVPSRVIRELVFMSKEEGGEGVGVFVPKESNQIIFSQNETTLVGRLIEGEFPQFEKIIPQEFSTKVFFEKEDLQRAVKSCYVFARETAGVVKLSVGKGEITVSANAPSLGKNTVEVEAKTEGEENEIAFNARYLLDLFAHLGDPSLVFEMTGPLSPGVFKIAQDNSFLHLIMPIRLQEPA